MNKWAKMQITKEDNPIFSFPVLLNTNCKEIPSKFQRYYLLFPKG